MQDDVRKIEVPDPNELRGLPADFLERFGVRNSEAKDGQLTADQPVTLTTDPPVLAPVMTYAASSALRRRMYLAYNDRGYPVNAPVLLDLLKVREEMAEVLGFRSWADLATVDQMMGSAANMRKFLSDVEHAARETAQREFTELEAFVRSRDPKALPLTLSDARFWEEQYRRSYYDFDSQSVRPFFPYEQVESGILAIAGKLFGVRFERNTSAPVWHPDVKGFRRLRSLGKVLRTQRPSAESTLTCTPAKARASGSPSARSSAACSANRVPEASLVCNFTQPTDKDPALLQYSDVVTYFHEFGHLMHEILGGQQRWAWTEQHRHRGRLRRGPITDARGILRARRRPPLLRAATTRPASPSPSRPSTRMTRASAHGRALSTLTQVMYATYSMETHDRRAAELDLDTLLREGYDRFSKYEFVDGNRMYAAFTHLVGYTSNYYTYLFDKVIALEFFRRVHTPDRVINSSPAPVAQRYRRVVLEPGGSKPAARTIVRDFLGRETSMSALRSWIAREFAANPLPPSSCPATVFAAEGM